MIAIKGMEMPKSCHWDCPLCNEDGGACMLGVYDTKTDTKKERAKNCPLVEIVTCKDCKYWHDDGIMTTCDKNIGHGFPQDYFCADAERRE